MTLSDLITRLEGAEEGSRTLDWIIAETVGWTKYWSSQTIYLPPGVVESVNEDEPGATVSLPKFSQSVDAALTLVPEGLPYSFYRRTGGLHSVVLSGTAMTASAPSLPLAIVIAALKARLSEKDEG